METKITELIPFEKMQVLILPMRNGNMLRLIRLGISALAVLILPMRNGNISLR